MNIRKTLYVQLLKYDWEAEPQFSVSTYKTQSDETQTVMTIGEVEFNYEAPDDVLKRFDLFQIADLEKVKSKVFAKAENDIRRIDERIQSLRALESK